jgi:glycosyltransferase involved in cell wall biosynthesis
MVRLELRHAPETAGSPIYGPHGPRIAIAHDYLTQRGGAERVVLAMSRAFPDAPIYTMLYDPPNTYPDFAGRDVRVSRLNKVAALRRNHRAALPLLPFAAGSIFVDADVVLTSTSGWAHGFHTNGHKLVACHSPARWLYLRDEYLGECRSVIKRAVLTATSPYLRAWDRRAAMSCEKYFAISTIVQQRITDVYGIEADLLPSPVSMTDRDPVEPIRHVQQWLSRTHDQQFYLCVARLLPYKNVAAVVEAFASGDRRLVVVGRGPQAAHIRRIKTDNVLMLSDLADAELKWLYRQCRALIAASYEDYGLTAIEAGVWGRPTLALGRGGFLDTVEDGISGLFFDRPEPQVITEALDRFEMSTFDPDKIRRHVAQFSEKRYIERLYAVVEDVVRHG